MKTTSDSISTLSCFLKNKLSPFFWKKYLPLFLSWKRSRPLICFGMKVLGGIWIFFNNNNNHVFRISDKITSSLRFPPVRSLWMMRVLPIFCLEHVYICYFRREIVPSSVGSGIKRVELFSSHPVSHTGECGWLYTSIISPRPLRNSKDGRFNFLRRSS